MSATERRFSAIDGTPLHYWRWTDGTAGTRSEPRTFASTNDFYERLVGWVRDLRALAAEHGGLESMQRIVTAGVYVRKPGQHGLGQAFDLDEVRWANGAITPYGREHASGDRVVVRRYLALDAVTRRHFRWVLDGGYNAAHADHIHMDLASLPVRCAPTSRSDTVFVQQACNAHMDAGLAVDGMWGPRTQAAFEESQRRLGVGGDVSADPAAWQTWLGAAAACGFSDRAFGEQPPSDPVDDLLDDLLQQLPQDVEPLAG